MDNKEIQDFFKEFFQPDHEYNTTESADGSQGHPGMDLTDIQEFFQLDHNNNTAASTDHPCIPPIISCDFIDGAEQMELEEFNMNQNRSKF
uniref:AGC-kinase C-terminal domain-containing protein n=1 Tax=Steinernema glaseri TaxID=37863 RepID=A0A1I7ZI66_9BILA